MINIKTAIAAIGIATSSVFGLATSQTPAQINETAPIYAPEPTIEEIISRIEDPRLKTIISKLSVCESTNNPIAINPKDLDGTASYGLLQFKPSTLYAFGKQYNTLPPDIEKDEILNIIYDPEIQIKTAIGMINQHGHKRSFWQQQWPSCSRKYNYFENY